MRSSATALIALVGFLIPRVSTALYEPVTNVTVEEATGFALTYAYPLIPYAQNALPLLATNPPNTLKHMRRLAMADFERVVRPNVDTLYSALIVDLSHSDLILEVPRISDRYWVFPFYDVYGNNYANIGSTSNSTASKFLVRYGPAVDQEPGVQLCRQECDEDCHGYSGFINAPTVYGTFMARYLVKDNGTDLEMVHGIQNHTHLYPADLQDHPTPPHAPALSVDMLNSSLPNDTAHRIMELAARFTPYNPPRNITDLSRVNNMLRVAGIHDGRYEHRTKNLAPIAHRAVRSVKATVAANNPSVGNGWHMLNTTVQGDYYMSYKMRAYFCYFGYLALTAREALYPNYQPGGSSGGLNIGADEAYIITFDSKPLLTAEGFWSLTAYNEQQSLIDNPMDRYSLGDRSALTYPDGTLVYGDRPDERKQPFKLLVQPADVQPPGNWTSNWLPAPPGGGNFTITLRFYAPKEALENGSWTYPVVQKHSAITR